MRPPPTVPPSQDPCRREYCQSVLGRLEPPLPEDADGALITLTDERGEVVKRFCPK